MATLHLRKTNYELNFIIVTGKTIMFNSIYFRNIMFNSIMWKHYKKKKKNCYCYRATARDKSFLQLRANITNIIHVIISCDIWLRNKTQVKTVVIIRIFSVASITEIIINWKYNILINLIKTIFISESNIK